MKSLVLVVMFFLAACTSPIEKEVKMNTDIEQLKKLISSPATLTQGSWSIVKSGSENGLGPNDWALVALLTFSTETVEQLTKKEILIQQGDNLLPVIDWYPDKLVQHLKKVNERQYATLFPRYSADVFFSSPLLNGFFFRIGNTNDIYIYLYTT